MFTEKQRRALAGALAFAPITGLSVELTSEDVAHIRDEIALHIALQLGLDPEQFLTTVDAKRMMG